MKRVLMIAIVALGLVGCGEQYDTAETPTTSTSSSLEQVNDIVVKAEVDLDLVLELVNDARSIGRMCGEVYYAPTNPLTYDRPLTNSATSKAVDLAVSNDFTHEGSGMATDMVKVDTGKPHFAALIDLYTETPRNHTGENIARAYVDEHELVNAWVESPEHCYNLMDPTFNKVGMAAWESLYGEIYWTQHFSN